MEVEGPDRDEATLALLSLLAASMGGGDDDRGMEDAIPDFQIPFPLSRLEGTAAEGEVAAPYAREDIERSLGDPRSPQKPGPDLVLDKDPELCLWPTGTCAPKECATSSSVNESILSARPIGIGAGELELAIENEFECGKDVDIHGLPPQALASSCVRWRLLCSRSVGLVSAPFVLTSDRFPLDLCICSKISRCSTRMVFTLGSLFPFRLSRSAFINSRNCSPARRRQVSVVPSMSRFTASRSSSSFAAANRASSSLISVSRATDISPWIFSLSACLNCSSCSGSTSLTDRPPDDVVARRGGADMCSRVEGGPSRAGHSPQRVVVC